MHGHAPQGRASYPQFAGLYIEPREHSQRRRPRSSARLEDAHVQDHRRSGVRGRFVANETGNPPGKLADAEVVFEAEARPR